MIFCILTPAARAANFTVTLDPDTITLGESATLTMTFEGGEPRSMPALPPIPNLVVGNQGRSERSSFTFDGVNQRMSSQITYSYSLHASQAGKYVIPSLKAEVGGQPFVSQPLKLTVVNPGPPAPGGNAPNPQSELAFLKLFVPRTEVYVGEVVQVELQLHLRDTIPGTKDFQLAPLPAEGFTVGKMSEGPHRQTLSNGLGYTVVPLYLSVTAAKVGKLTLGPAGCSLGLLLGPVNFFGQPSRMQPVNLTSEPVVIQSLPLPKDNMPPGFNGAVGTFSMTASVSPTNIAVGDPLTVKVQISGHGAIDSVTLPKQSGWDQFKVYPPTSEFQTSDRSAMNGTKSFALTAVPQSTDIKELPPFSFSFLTRAKKLIAPSPSQPCRSPSAPVPPRSRRLSCPTRPALPIASRSPCRTSRTSNRGRPGGRNPPATGATALVCRRIPSSIGLALSSRSTAGKRKDWPTTRASGGNCSWSRSFTTA